MLSRRALTHKELRDRLYRKGADSQTASEIAVYFVEAGYINEAQIVEDHIRLGREVKLSGRFRLRRELEARGIGKEMIEDGLDKFYPPENELEIARQFAKKKIRISADLSKDKRNRRLAGALQRRGFSGEVVRRIMNEISGETTSVV